MQPFFFTIKTDGTVSMQVRAEHLITDVKESNNAVERRSIFARLIENEAGAIEDCLKEHGNLVWAIAKKHADSAEDAENMSEEIFSDLWKNAAFGIDVCDEKEFVALVACRYLLKSKKYKADESTAK